MHPSRFFLTASLAALFVFVPTASFAATYTVTTTDDTADGVCDSGCSLREAVIAANGGGVDTIIIPAGTYHFTRTAANEDLASTGDLDFTDTDLTTVTGAGSGLGGGATIIDPDDNDRGIDVKSGAAVSITGLTVNDGNLSSAGGMGAGILTQGTLTLSNVTVTGNSLITAGTDGYGAGLGCLSGSVNISNSVISNNLGTSASGNVIGGGLAIAPLCSSTLSIVTISGNQAMNGGGVAVFTASNELLFTDVTISNNIAGDAGGGVFSQPDGGTNPLVINRALIEANQASAGGGVFTLSPLTITNASFYDNYASDTGGALSSQGNAQAVRLAFVTMTRNTGGLAAAGIYAGGLDPDVRLKNSIVTANYAGTAEVDDIENATDCNGDIISGDYNFIGNIESCNFVSQANDIIDGTPSSIYFTATPTDEGGNVEVTSLWATGETLDIIPAASCTDFSSTAVTTDASNRARPQNTRCDVGAYEKPDTVTQTPTLSSPASSSNGTTMHLTYSLPETPLTDSVLVTLDDGVNPSTLLSMDNNTTVDTTLNLANLTASSHVLLSNHSTLPDGTYTVTLQYRDATGNAAVTAVASSVRLDTATQSPTLSAPATSSMRTVHLQYSLPETPLGGTVSVAFTNTTTSAVTTFSMQNATSVDITFNPADSGNAINVDNFSVISSISPSPMPVLADGTYTVLLRYQDLLGNSYATASKTGVVIDTTTQAPVLNSPTSGAKLNSPALSYTLPETPQASSVSVVFFDGATTTTLTMDNSISVNTSLQLSNLGTTSGVTSASRSTLSDGTYTVTLSYVDSLGNPATSTIATGVIIDTNAPTITLLGASTQTLTVGDTYTDPGYTATDAIDGNLHDSVHVLNTVNVNVAGVYTIYYTLTDTTGNVATQVTRTVTVVEAEVVEEPVDNTPTENTVSIPAKPTAVTVTKKKKAKLIIWDAVSESSYYNVIIKTKAGKTKLSKTNITALKYKLTAAWIKQHLTVGKSYTIKLKACNTAGCSAWSSAATLKLPLTKPKS